MSDQIRVLVPLDGSSLAEQAIPFAVTIAGPTGRIVFVQVTPEAEAIRALSGRVSASEEEVHEIDQERAEESCNHAAEHWKSILTTSPETVIVTGDPAEQILNVAAQQSSTYIVMASHGRGAVRRLAFGSVADRIARSTTIPVLIVRPSDAEVEQSPAHIRRLVVPLDGSPLSEEALPVAIALATSLHTPIHLVQAINPSALVLPSAGSGAGVFPAELYTEIEQELTTEASNNIARAAADLGARGLAFTSAVVDGPPVLAIEDSVEGGDVIVMTSHGRSGLKRWLLGSTAEKLIRSGPAPVLLVPATARG
jgi:nucleotide-binding universal stress UspA family protein